MSRSPLVLSKPDAPWARSQKLEDTTLGWRFVNPLMRERYGVDSMAETAENVAAECGVARADQDAFALRSQQRARRPCASGGFARGDHAGRGSQEGRRSMRDEHPRPDTTLEGLAELKPVIKAGGTVTAGNASGINDGAGALLLASETAAARHGLTPRARFVGSAAAGVAPRVMGLGPVPAVRKLLDAPGFGWIRWT